MIGGIDKVLWVNENAPATEIILRIVRHHWPGYVFQNADDERPVHQIPAASLPQPSGREFFLYRDWDAAADWHQSGATADNKNSLIYVILGNRRKPELGLRSITLVGGEWKGDTATILADIQSEFDRFVRKAPVSNHEPALGPMPQVAKRE